MITTSATPRGLAGVPGPHGAGGTRAPRDRRFPGRNDRPLRHPPGRITLHPPRLVALKPGDQATREPWNHATKRPGAKGPGDHARIAHISMVAWFPGPLVPWLQAGRIPERCRSVR